MQQKLLINIWQDRAADKHLYAGRFTQCVAFDVFVFSGVTLITTQFDQVK